MPFLELLDAAGQLVARRSADALPCTVGRGAENALVVEDEYVEQRHAEIVRAENGGLLVRDLGSTNGLRRPGSDDASIELGLSITQPVQIGQAILRLVADAPVRAKALPPSTASAGPTWLSWVRRREVRIGAPMALLAVVAVSTLLSSNAVRPVVNMLTVVLGVGLLLLVWAAGWALASRIRTGEARYTQHLAAASAGALLLWPLQVASEWVTFLLPDGWLDAVVGTAVLTVAWYVLLRLHLRVQQPQLHRRTPAIALGVAVAFSGCTLALPSLASGGYTTAATFGASLKPLPASLVPTTSDATYTAALDDLKGKLDADHDTLPSIGDAERRDSTGARTPQ